VDTLEGPDGKQTARNCPRRDEEVLRRIVGQEAYSDTQEGGVGEEREREVLLTNRK
jgi:hypothetical protein